MADLPAETMSDDRSLGALDRALFIAVCVATVAAFWTLGWMAMGPINPRGAVSLLSTNGGIGAMVQAMGLAWIASGVATLLLGRRLPRVGLFVAAVGVMSVSIRGETASYLFIERSDLTAGGFRGIGGTLGLEAVGWFIVVLSSWPISQFVHRWCVGADGDATDGSHPVESSSGDTASLSDGNVAQGLMHLGIAAIATVVVVTLLSSGRLNRAVEHGQACFVAAAGVALGCYLAQRIVPVSAMRWSILSIPVSALVGYAGGALLIHQPAQPLPVPPSAYLAILPIQYASAGVIGLILSHWNGGGHPHSLQVAGDSDRSESRAR